MKKITIFMLLFCLLLILFADDSLIPSTKTTDQSELPFTIKSGKIIASSRNPYPAPDCEFISNGAGQFVVPIMESTYDFHPFSNNGNNVQMQPNVSQPNDINAGGIYIGFMAKESDSSLRQIYFGYLNADGELVSTDHINPCHYHYEGFSSIAVDYYSGNLFSIWHAELEGEDFHKCMMSYNLYHENGDELDWTVPYLIIDNPDLGESLTGVEGDEFIWPQIRVGSSPLSGHRRIYIYANNNSANSEGHSYGNIVYGYSDFTMEDLESHTELDWDFRAFPYFNNNHYNDIDKVVKDMVISKDGKVAFFGSVGGDLFVMLSTDFGETFTTYTQNVLQYIGNPDFWGEDLCIHPSEDGNQYNGVFTNDNSRIVWMSGVNVNTVDGYEYDYYMPILFYPKIFSFNLNTESFHFYEVDIQDQYPADDEFCIPWDLDNDGEVDEWDGDFAVIPLSHPSWFFNGDFQRSYFYHGRFQLSSNNNWAVATWHDYRKHYNAYMEEEEGYENWLEQPEIAFTISVDGGISWSDIAYINANPADAEIDASEHLDGNYYSVLDSMIMTDITLSNELEILENSEENYHAALNLAFYKDNSYGSSIHGDGEDLGGTICYAKLDITFPEAWDGAVAAQNNDEVASNPIHLRNYPNPFNPTTVISFQLSDTSIEKPIELEIYNIKGQKVKQLLSKSAGKFSSGKHSIVWNGNDQNNDPVSSGVYFYKLNVGSKTIAMKKCLLLK